MKIVLKVHVWGQRDEAGHAATVNAIEEVIEDGHISGNLIDLASVLKAEDERMTPSLKAKINHLANGSRHHLGIRATLEIAKIVVTGIQGMQSEVPDNSIILISGFASFASEVDAWVGELRGLLKPTRITDDLLIVYSRPKDWAGLKPRARMSGKNALAFSRHTAVTHDCADGVIIHKDQLLRELVS